MGVWRHFCAAFVLGALVLSPCIATRVESQNVNSSPRQQTVAAQSSQTRYHSVFEVDRARRRANEQLNMLRQRGQSIASLHNGILGLQDSFSYAKRGWLSEHNMIIEAAKNFSNLFPKGSVDTSKITSLVQLGRSLRAKQATRLQTQLQGVQAASAGVSGTSFTNFSPLEGGMDRNLSEQLRYFGVACW